MFWVKVIKKKGKHSRRTVTAAPETRAQVSGAASSLSRSREVGLFLLASCRRLLVTSRGFVVSPVLVNALRLPSPPQFRSKDAAETAHAPTLRHRRGRWQKADFSLEKPFSPRLLAGFWLLPGALCYDFKQPPRGLLQKTQTTKLPDLAVVARTLFWSFCAGQRRIGRGQITDGT